MTKFDYTRLIAERVPAGVPIRHLARPAYDFGVGFPDPASFPTDGLHEALGRALREKGRDLVLYPDPQGHPEMREFIAQKLARERGMAVHPDQVLVTGGSGAAVALFLQLLTDPGDVLLTEEFSYVGTLRTMRDLRAHIVGVETDAEGMRPDALDRTIAQYAAEGRKPKLIYTIPTFQNPLGTDMGRERRQAILAVAQRHGVPVFEDDAYEDLRFTGERSPAIHSYDDGDGVLYVGTLSKILAPGMRLGFLVAPIELIPRVGAMYWGRPTSEFAVLAALYYLRDQLDAHVDDITAILERRRDAMIAAIGESMGAAVKTSKPDGGLYVWVTLPEGADTGPVLEKARERGVAYLAGAACSPSGVGGNHLRLCFGYETEDKIREGIDVLARVFTEEGMI